MANIHNPILPGFNPDPSIIRVGDDYYIATSTFEWFPGVQIHHSRDLINWRVISHPLNRISQLDLRGISDSGGIWAPCLSYDQGRFYLCYTIVLNHEGIFWNMHNYLVTADQIDGEWSDPIFLNSDGFDPSLFHNSDGSKWLVHRSLDYRTSNRGIALQEFSIEEGRLTGDQIIIFVRSTIGDAEGPHLYKRNGWYYLTVAEGGTGLGHCVTVARSRDIKGPYEIDPLNPMLTSRDDILLPIQKAGHADIVETQNGEWYMVHLCGRPMPTRGVCTLGRETCMQRVYWNEEGWLRLYGGGNKPHEYIPAPELQECTWPKVCERDDFNCDILDIHFQTLRIPYDGYYISLKDRPGYLRLRGRESLNSRFEQSLVAHRQSAFRYTAATCLEFEPGSFKQMAGLTCYYNTMCFYYLKTSFMEGIGKSLEIIICDNGNYTFPVKEPVCIDGWGRIYLKAEVDYDKLQYLYSKDGIEWNNIGPILDASILSDEHISGWAFTGAFTGICCQDLTGKHLHADFDFFEYVER